MIYGEYYLCFVDVSFIVGCDENDLIFGRKCRKARWKSIFESSSWHMSTAILAILHHHFRTYTTWYVVHNAQCTTNAKHISVVFLFLSIPFGQYWFIRYFEAHIRLKYSKLNVNFNAHIDRGILVLNNIRITCYIKIMDFG